MPSVTERLDTLESIVGQFIVHTDVGLRRLEKEWNLSNGNKGDTMDLINFEDVDKQGI